MRLSDRLYFRVGLFHKRYGRMLCAFIEGFLVGLVVLLALCVLWGAAHVWMWAYERHIAEQTEHRVRQVEKEKWKYERIVLACLNRQWFLADGELMTCEVK